MKKYEELDNPEFLKTYVEVLDYCLPTPNNKCKTPQESYDKLKGYMNKIGIDSAQLLVSALTYLSDDFLPDYGQDPNPTLVAIANTSLQLADETQQYQFILSTAFTALHSSLTPEWKSTIKKSKVFQREKLEDLAKDIQENGNKHMV